MKIIRAATLTVADIGRSQALYGEWLDYKTVEAGRVSDALAASWNAPNSAGAPYVVMQPASGANVFIRFVQQTPHPDYTPLISFGWAAIEICVKDVLAVNERLERSPFEIIGPPTKIDGLPTIFPMQVRGPDGEIVYLTQIDGDLPEYDLPRAGSLIDKLFILVMACSDMDASRDWIAEHARLTAGEDMEIVYTLLADAFGLPEEDLHRLCTLRHERDVFLELDQLPDAGAPRPTHQGMLPPGAAIGTFAHPDFKAIKGPWISPPALFDSVVYGEKPAATLLAPDGTLIELTEA